MRRLKKAIFGDFLRKIKFQNLLNIFFLVKSKENWMKGRQKLLRKKINPNAQTGPQKPFKMSIFDEKRHFRELKSQPMLNYWS